MLLPRGEKGNQYLRFRFHGDMGQDMPLHGLKFGDPLLDRGENVIVESLMSVGGFVDHILD